MDKPIFGLIGRKLGHSWSVPIHQALGCSDYRLIELEPEQLSEFLAQKNIGGLNVTIPYKRDVIPLCDRVDPAALEIGSVNTIARRPDGTLWGWNTDITGFLWMARRAEISFVEKKVIVLGTGGASLTAQAAARQQGAEEIVVISRSGKENYDNLSRHADAQIIINATPVGMYPNTGVALVDLRHFPACCGVLDVVYNPMRTALLLQAEELGIPNSNGLSMLVAQAVAAEEHFFERSIPASESERILAMLHRDSANLVLIGMPGCGKTTVGQVLAAQTGRTLVDLDDAIVQAAGCSIPEIFARDGEAAFRTLEQEQAARFGRESGLILVTGGGVVKTPANRASLRQNGRIYQLSRPLVLLAREGRPLSQGADLTQMAQQRAPLYAEFRDVLVENIGTPEETAAAIWRDFCEHSGH